MTPAVSVVVPSYNYARYLGECMESILCQSLRDLEVIVIDDASTDDTAAVLSRFAGDRRAQVIRHQRNVGHLKTYAEGIGAARGRYLVLMSADDRCMDPNAFDRQVRVLEEHETVGFVYSATAIIDEWGNVMGITRPWERDFVRSGLDEFAALLFADHINHSGTMVRRQCYFDQGGYDEALPNSCDWEMWLRLSAHYDVGYIADPLHGYRLHSQNMSLHQVSMGQAIDDARSVINKAFRYLPPEAAMSLRPLRSKALSHGLVHQAEVELGFDRKGRAWRGLLAATRRDPTVLVRSKFPLVLLLRTLLGKKSFHQLHLAYRRRRPRPVPS